MRPTKLLALSPALRRWVVIAALLNVAGVAATIAFGVLTGLAVADVLDQSSPNHPFPARLVGWLIVAAVVRAVVAWAQSRLGDHAADDAIADLRARATAHLAGRDPRSIDKAQWLQTLTTGMEGIRPYITGFLPAATASALSTPIALAAVAWLDVPSALWAAATIPLIPFFMWLVGTLTKDRTEPPGSLINYSTSLRGFPPSWRIIANAGRIHPRAKWSGCRWPRRTPPWRC